MAPCVLKEEFRLKNFKYEHHDETVFYRCQWKWPRPVFVAIRVLLALYALYGFIHELVHYYKVAYNPDAHKNSTDTNSSFYYSDTTWPSLQREITTTEDPRFNQWDSRRPWFVFFTLWTYMILLLHLCLSAALSIIFYGSADKSFSHRFIPSETDLLVSTDASTPGTPELGYNYDSTKLSNFLGSSDSTLEASINRSRPSRLVWYLQLSWLLSNLITPCAPIVTTIFFAALYKGGPVDIYDTNVHILNTAMMIVDHVISARPIRLLHAPAAMLLGFIYSAFSAAFWSSDHVHHVVYPGVLDWNQPAQAVATSVVLIFVAVPFVQLVWVLLYQLKIWVHAKMNAL